MAAAVSGTKRSFAFMTGEGPAASLSPVRDYRPSASPSRTPSRLERGRSTGWDDNGSRASSSPPTPIPTQAAETLPRSFDQDASIVLVGVRGTGKSTLAVIASAAFQRRVVDTDYAFQETTGHSSAAYRKMFGVAEHNRQQQEVFRSVLSKHSKNCVIVCNTGSMERSGQALLKEYARTHPIIHVVRDSKGIRDYLRIPEQSRVTDLLKVSGAIFRGCSNFEFYNLSEVNQSAQDVPIEVGGDLSARDLASGQRSPAPFLTLKRAEKHFLKFITLVTAKAKIPSLESAFPLSQVPTEARQYTYAVCAPVSVLSTEDLDVEDVEVGADAFELVVDDILSMSNGASKPMSARLDHISMAFSRVRRNTIVPVIFHTSITDATIESVRSAYLDFVRQGLRLAPEFATVDLSLSDDVISQIVSVKGPTRIIGHLSLYGEDAPGWDDAFWSTSYERAARLGCDLVRLLRPARTMEDNIAVQRFREKMALNRFRLPLIAYNTGYRGRHSAFLNPTLTRVTHPMLQKVQEPDKDIHGYYRERHPCITAKEATEALYAAFVFDPMHFYIVGAASGYSLSPAMHNASYKACGMPHHYETHQAPTLSNLRALVHDPHFGGAAIALPFKVEVIAITHSLSRHARAIGAVNTLIPVRHLSPDGSIPDDISLIRERNQAGPVKALYGENTDWIGIRACVRRGLSPANAVQPKTTGLIIGAGGMARSAVYALLQLGVKNIFVFNRSTSNAEKLITHFSRLVSNNDQTPNGLHALTATFAGAEFHLIKSRDDQWPEAFRQPTIIVSCIPSHSVGDNPAPNFTLPPQWLKSPTGGVVLEVAYKTLTTPLLDQIKAEAHRGYVAMDGLDLLPEQGYAQFELFTGRRAPRRLMRTEVYRSWKDEEGRTDHARLQTRLENASEQEP
ncbi:hypothetical protein H2199_000495 [Coniosporium tulheliwenetii]|uniref:Uncharacterized protein n=1 Tax=Coniosporium tulheliwenetii TaxID=3383036 RepID=A0ACC2ZQ15_9PEZI|nr:hypothetical protein H2199_000495 [Cladosporium sp. JES 115]